MNKAGSLKCGHAFTLLELIGVIAIIAVLAALLFPAVGKMMASAEGAKCAGNLRVIGGAWAAYTADNNKYPEAETRTGYWATDFYWPARINNYMGLPVLSIHSYVNTVAFCPGNHGKNYHRSLYSGLSYIPNALVGGYYKDDGSQMDSTPGFGYTPKTRPGSINKPSEVGIFFCAKEETVRGCLDLENPAPYVGTHHNGGANVLFADGHVGVGAYKPKEAGKISDEDQLQVYSLMSKGLDP